MTDALRSTEPIPAVNMPNEPAPGPRFFRGMSYKGFHTLCKQRGHPHRDARALLITRLLAMDQLDRKRAPVDPEAQASAAKERSPLGTLHSVVVAGKNVIKNYGQCWNPVIKDRWAASPSSPVGGVDAAISARTADLCGRTEIRTFGSGWSRARTCGVGGI